MKVSVTVKRLLMGVLPGREDASWSALRPPAARELTQHPVIRRRPGQTLARAQGRL